MEIPPIPARTNSFQGQSGPTATGKRIEEERKITLVEGINVKMTAKGKYYWDIQTYGALSEVLVLKIKEIDGYLRREFNTNVATE